MIRRSLAWAAVALTLILTVVGFGPSVGVAGTSTVAGSVGFLAAWTLYSVIGAMIVTLRPGQPVGWLFVMMGLAAEVGLVAQAQSEASSSPAFWLALLSNSWVVAFALLAYLIMVFPNGHLPSPRWRVAAIFVVVVVAVGLITSGSSVDRSPMAIAFGSAPLIASIVAVGRAISGLGMLVLLVIGPVAMMQRFARARGVERQQLKWFAYGSILLGLAIIVTAVAYFTPPLRALDPNARVPPAMFGGIPAVAGLLAIPVAAGIAILRYRLYDIDLLIRRTLVYGALSATLVAVYIGLVIALQGVLSGFTGGSSLAVAASTLAVAALFQPLRRRIQAAVDRRFYRSRYDAARTLGAFSSRLRHEVDLAHLTEELRGVVAETLQPTSVSVWLRERT